jgi:drug/metabolite transporter (DMT)-like permease
MGKIIVLLRIYYFDRPNATVFNRFWIATVIFGVWRMSKTIASQLSEHLPAPNNTYAISDIISLIISAIITSISHITLVSSLTQTSIANANLLHYLTPIFTTFGGWLLLGHKFGRRFLIGMFLQQFSGI